MVLLTHKHDNKQDDSCRSVEKSSIQRDDEKLSTSPAHGMLSVPHPQRRSTMPSIFKRQFLIKKDSVCQVSVDYYLKFVLLGDCGTGKTSLSRAYRCGTVAPQHRRRSDSQTTTVECFDKLIHRSKKAVLARVYDTAGQEKYRSLTASYYRGAHGCLILYDVTKESSFDNINYWLHDLKEYTSQPEISTILVGTKCHVNEERREVAYDRAQKYAESVGIPYMEVSAEEGINVTEVFEKLADLIIENLCKDQTPVVNPSNRVTLDPKDQNPKKKQQWCSC